MCALSVHHRHDIIQMLQRPLTNAKYSWEMLKSCSLCWFVFFCCCLVLLILLLLIVAPFLKISFSVSIQTRVFFCHRKWKSLVPLFVVRLSYFPFIEIHCQRQSPAVFCRPSWEYSVILLPNNNVFQFQTECWNDYSITNISLVLKIFLHLTNDENCMLNDDQQRKHDKRNKIIKIISLKSTMVYINRQILFRHTCCCCCYCCSRPFSFSSSSLTTIFSLSHSIRIFCCWCDKKNLWKIWFLHISNIYATICCGTERNVYKNRKREATRNIRLTEDRKIHQHESRAFQFSSCFPLWTFYFSSFYFSPIVVVAAIIHIIVVIIIIMKTMHDGNMKILCKHFWKRTTEEYRIKWEWINEILSCDFVCNMENKFRKEIQNLLHEIRFATDSFVKRSCENRVEMLTAHLSKSEECKHQTHYCHRLKIV